MRACLNGSRVTSSARRCSVTDPIPYPAGAVRPASAPDQAPGVHPARGKAPTPVMTLPPSAQIAVLRRLAERARCRKGVLDVQEAFKLGETVEELAKGVAALQARNAELERVLEEKHSERLAGGGNH